MIQEIYQTTIKYAGIQHQNQKVPGSNANYLLHLSNVAMEVLMAHQALPNFDLAYAVQLALLHDTIEDTSSTYSEIEQLFGKSVAEGVQALTKNETLPTKEKQMLDSLERISKLRKEVGLVKLADRITNLQKPPEHWPKEKIKKYLVEAILISTTLKTNNENLYNRILLKIEDYQKYLN